MCYTQSTDIPPEVKIDQKGGDETTEKNKKRHIIMPAVKDGIVAGDETTLEAQL